MIDYHIGCFAHLLHLAVTESIQEVPDVSLVVNRVHDFVAKFKTSGTLRSVFDQQRQFLQAQGLNSKMEFQLDNVTRWNSIHKMLSSFCSLHQIAKVCCEISPSFNSAFQSTPNLSSVQDIVRILEPVSKMSIMWQETTQPILSEIYPVLFSLQSSLPSLPKTPLGNSLAKSICSNLVVRFSTSDTVFLTDMSVHVLASAIDPRPFKRLDFLTKQQRKSVTLRLKKMFDEFKPSYKEAKPKSTSLLDSFMGWDAASSTSSHSFDEEYKRFLALSPECAHCNPLQWWQRNSEAFPGLAELAYRIFAVEPTSAASERVFSACTSLFEKKRLSLTSKNASMIIFLHCNSL